jgi:hypothetical protein
VGLHPCFGNVIAAIEMAVLLEGAKLNLGNFPGRSPYVELSVKSVRIDVEQPWSIPDGLLPQHIVLQSRGFLFTENFIRSIMWVFLYSIPTNRMIVRIGEYDFRDSNSSYPHVDIRVSERVIHQKFNFLTFENDIALLRLAEPVKLAPHIIPICIAPYKNYTGSYGIK